MSFSACLYRIFSFSLCVGFNVSGIFKSHDGACHGQSEPKSIKSAPFLSSIRCTRSFGIEPYPNEVSKYTGMSLNNSEKTHFSLDFRYTREILTYKENSAETSGSGYSLSTSYWTQYGDTVYLMDGYNSRLNDRLKNSMFFWGDKVDLMKQSTSASAVSLTPAYSSAISSYILYDKNTPIVPINGLNTIGNVKKYFADSSNFFYILRKIAAVKTGAGSVTSIDTVAELLAPIANKYVTIDGVKKKVYQSDGTSANAWHNSSGATTQDYDGKYISLSPFSGIGGSSVAAVDWLIVYEPIFQVKPPNKLSYNKTGKRYICATPTELAVLSTTGSIKVTYQILKSPPMSHSSSSGSSP